MGFQDEFFFTGNSYAQLLLERPVAAGFKAERQQLTKLRKSLKSSYEAAANRMAHSQAESGPELSRELAFQADRIGREISLGSAQITDAIARGSADVVASIQRVCDYLGGELAEVRWAVERHTQVTEQFLQVLLHSLDNCSRQYLEQGVKCYEAGEIDLAKERFSKALEANRTNYFAYQYLGFLAVAQERPDETIRNFALAQKFAEKAYHQALALSHLARARRAIGQAEKAITLCREATAISPDTPKFWYELASHCAHLRREDDMANALQGAIERDWNYWAVVNTDSGFDATRLCVNTLLGQMRIREADKAKSQIEKLREALGVASTVGAEAETGDCQQAIRDLTSKYGQNNVFLHLEIQTDASAWRRKTLEIAQKVVEQRIAANRNDASLCNAKKEKCYQELDREISALRNRQFEIKFRSEGLRVAEWCVLYGIIWLLCMVSIPFFSSSISIGVSTLASFAIPVVVLLPLKVLVYLINVTIPVEKLEGQIREKEQRLESEKRRVADEFGLREATLEAELVRLSHFRTMCQNV